MSSTGTITPIDSYKVSALVNGEIVEAPFEEGDWVEKGALLYRFDAEDAQNAVQQAQLSVAQAQTLAPGGRPTWRLNRAFLIPPKKASFPLFSGRDRIATAPTWASASIMSTPGIT